VIAVSAPDPITRAGPFAAFVDRGFAGPSTNWRGVSLESGATFEVARIDPRSWTQPHDAVIAFSDDDGAALMLVPSAAGATLKEIVDASVEQRARLDAPLAVRIVDAIIPAVLSDPGQAISSSHVLVGFDGSVRVRGNLPWWPERRPPPLPSGSVIPTARGETVALLGIVVAEALTSRAGPPKSLALPTVDRSIRDDVRDLLVRLLESPLRPDVEELWDRDDVATDDEIRARLARITRRLPPADANDLGPVVQNLFASRFDNEKKTRDLIDELIAGYAP
jgi:hypothetical protein